MSSIFYLTRGCREIIRDNYHQLIVTRRKQKKKAAKLGVKVRIKTAFLESPGKLSPFKLKIEVSIVLNLT